MKRRVLLSLALGLMLLLLWTVAVVAKLPVSYSSTRGFYIVADEPSYNINPPQVPVVGGYRRFNWSQLEPQNGTPDWSTLDSWIQGEQVDGKKVGIGFSIFNEYRGQGTDRGIQVPAWLWQLHSDVRFLNNTYRPGEGWYIPNYLSTNLREHYGAFVQRLAQHIANDTLPNGTPIRDRVAWISAGIGLSGETQPSSQWVTDEKPDYDYYKNVQGMTSAQWVDYVNWCTDHYKDPFTAVGLSDLPVFIDMAPTYMGGSERDSFCTYAKSKGVGLRHNGLKMDREGSSYSQMRDSAYYNSVPTSFESYQAFLTDKTHLWWGLLCGLSKHPDSIALDKAIYWTDEYAPILSWASGYVGASTSNTPGAWVGLRNTDVNETGSGETGNYNYYMTQKDAAPQGLTTAVWNVGSKRGYKFSVPNGTYEVQLRFCETYYRTNPVGARVFTITMESQVVPGGGMFDIAREAGGSDRALDRTYTVVVSDGTLDIDFIQYTDNEPTISAIQAKQLPSGYVKRINCGGTTYTDKTAEQNVWEADREYEAGSYGYLAGGAFKKDDADVAGTTDDYLYQSMRTIFSGAQTMGRYARRTTQSSGNTAMRFDIANDYMYYGSFDGTATITVTYFDIRSTSDDKWRLTYDSVSGGTEKVATPSGSSDSWVTKVDDRWWKQAVFYLSDARFANGGPGSTDFSIECMGDGDEFISFVEVSKGGSPGPSTSLAGSVALQRPNKPAPDPSWSVPLTVTIGGTTQVVTTDSSGNFGVSGFEPGTYDITVKNAHTLSNVRRSVTLLSGVNTLSMGELKEGDANGDDRVNSSDFLLLRGAYFKSSGQSGFVDGADFNEDNVVNSSDFLLLRTNYFQNGPVELSSTSSTSAPAFTTQAQAAQSVTMSIDPRESTASAGEAFDLNVRIEAGTEQVAAADVYLHFDPQELEVIEVRDGQDLTVFVKSFDNAAGTLDIGAGNLGAPATGSFTLASVRFRAKQQATAGTTRVDFDVTAPRQTVVKNSNDQNLLGASSGGVVTVQVPTPTPTVTPIPTPSQYIYLPSIQRH